MTDDTDVVLDLSREDAEVLGRALAYATAWLEENHTKADTEHAKIQPLRRRLAMIMFPELTRGLGVSPENQMHHAQMNEYAARTLRKLARDLEHPRDERRINGFVVIAAGVPGIFTLDAPLTMVGCSDVETAQKLEGAFESTLADLITLKSAILSGRRFTEGADPSKTDG